MSAGCITGSWPATRQQRLRLTVDQTAIPGFVLPGVSEAQRTRCEQEVQRVLDSRAFAKASRLAALFEYICRKSLYGALDELTEQQIGIHVFRRSPGYNSAEDTIVRGTARLLRQRIETYYDQEGAHNGFRVSIPNGATSPCSPLQTSFPPQAQAKRFSILCHPQSLSSPP